MTNARQFDNEPIDAFANRIQSIYNKVNEHGPIQLKDVFKQGLHNRIRSINNNLLNDNKGNQRPYRSSNKIEVANEILSYNMNIPIKTMLELSPQLKAEIIRQMNPKQQGSAYLITENEESSDDEDQATNTDNNIINNGGGCPTFTIKIQDEIVNCYIDGGSGKNFLTKPLADKIGLDYSELSSTKVRTINDSIEVLDTDDNIAIYAKV